MEVSSKKERSNATNLAASLLSLPSLASLSSLYPNSFTSIKNSRPILTKGANVNFFSNNAISGGKMRNQSGNQTKQKRLISTNVSGKGSNIGLKAILNRQAAANNAYNNKLNSLYNMNTNLSIPKNIENRTTFTASNTLHPLSTNTIINQNSNLTNLYSNNLNANISEFSMQGSMNTSKLYDNYRYTLWGDVCMVEKKSENTIDLDDLTRIDIRNKFLKLMEEMMTQTREIQEVYNLFVLNNVELLINDKVGINEKNKTNETGNVCKTENIISCFKYLVKSNDNVKYETIYSSKEKLTEYHNKLDKWYKWKTEHWLVFKYALKTNYELYANKNENVVFYYILMTLAEWQLRARVLYLVKIAHEIYAQLLKNLKHKFDATVDLVASYSQQLIVIREKCLENRQNLVELVACFLFFNKDRENSDWMKINEALATFNALDQEMRLSEILDQPLERIIIKAEMRAREMEHEYKLENIEKTDKYRKKVVERCMMFVCISTCALNMQSYALNYLSVFFKTIYEIIDFFCLKKVASISHCISSSGIENDNNITKRNNDDSIYVQNESSVNKSTAIRFLDNYTSDNIKNEKNITNNIAISIAYNKDGSSELNEEEKEETYTETEEEEEESILSLDASSEEEEDDEEILAEEQRKKKEIFKDNSQQSQSFTSEAQGCYRNPDEAIIALAGNTEMCTKGTGILEKTFTRHMESLHAESIKRSIVDEKKRLNSLGCRKTNVMECNKSDETAGSYAADFETVQGKIDEGFNDNGNINKHNDGFYIKFDEQNGNGYKTIENIFNIDDVTHSLSYNKKISQEYFNKLDKKNENEKNNFYGGDNNSVLSSSLSNVSFE